MLSEITIKNLAIIEDLTLSFSSGFNVLTGETGAGKSIILDAVSLLLGGRADTNVVRSGAEMALIEGCFEVRPGPMHDQIAAVIKREELDGDSPDILLLTREVRRGGRSVCRVNGHTISLNVLTEIAEGLVDIHGQSEHLTLLKPATHIDLLDRFGALLDHRAAFAEWVRKVEAVRAEITTLTNDTDRLKRRADVLSYHIEEITAANLKAGEEDDLRNEAKRLSSAEQLAALTSEAYQAIYESDFGSTSANDLISQAALAVSKLVRFDPATKDMADLAQSVAIQVEELARSLAHYQESIEFDPDRLRETEKRVELISDLKRKHSVESIPDLLRVRDEAVKELDSIEHNSERIEQLQAEEITLLAQIGKHGAALSEKRHKAAKKLGKAVEAELSDLRMKDARFEVALDRGDDPSGAPVGDYRVAFTSAGIDRVEFMIAPNPGEPLHPMAKIASGGETSRIMLALKEVLSRADQTPTLIFDEIDAGIGGRIGAVVGHKLWSLSETHQVLVVTHLPQLAGFADAHFKVEKRWEDKRTVTRVERLGSEGQVTELTEMLGAEADSARQSAQDILRYVQQIKQAAPSPSAG